MYYIGYCKLANQEHKAHSRNFAHVFHVQNKICVAKDIEHLPYHYALGILLHEMGHIVLEEDENHTEKDADKTGLYVFGINIYRRNLGKMKNLECIRIQDVNKASRIIKRFLNAR